MDLCINNDGRDDKIKRRHSHEEMKIDTEAGFRKKMSLKEISISEQNDTTVMDCLNIIVNTVSESVDMQN